jgi:hypothetical protein
MMEGVCGVCPAYMLIWLLSDIFAGAAFLAAYKFHAKLLFFAVSSSCVLSH